MNSPADDSPTDNGSSTDDSREARVKSAVEAVRARTLSFRDAAKQFDIPATTISNRLKGGKAPSIAHESQQLLSNEQQKVVIEWLRWRGDNGNPMTREQLAALIFDLTERRPGANWIRKFLRSHADKIAERRAHGLDPKCAQAFNEAVVTRHFELLESLIVGQSIPPENIYNEDEKGIQLGGGRKNLPLQYIFSKEDRDKYVVRSDSLILVTLLEAVSADGVAVPPLFVLPGGKVTQEDLQVPDIGG